MKSKTQKTATEENDGPVYSAPALEKGLDILEMLCRSEQPLSQKDIARGLDRSVGEIYRMLSCLVNRNYVVHADDTYRLTTKLFELAHINPPTQRLLSEALPVMQSLSSELEQSCHITLYNQGRQVVVAKIDNPSGMGFSIRVGAELDNMLFSASGRVLLAFLDAETQKLRIRESLQRRPDHADIDIAAVLERVRKQGYEALYSVQVKGLYACSYPILNTQGHVMAALTVPYAERIDQSQRKTIKEVEKALGLAAAELSRRVGGKAAS
jgi:DNA-binding IclR family transcriptional regulator